MYYYLLVNLSVELLIKNSILAVFNSFTLSDPQYNTKSLKTKAWLVIVNPAAAGGKGKNIWPRIKKELIIQKIEFNFYFSEYAQHTILLAKNAVEKGCRKLLGVGGDGTLNEMVNGIFQNEENVDSRDVTIACIPVGTGNDWTKSHGIGNSYREAIGHVKKNRVVLQDIGKVSMTRGNGDLARYYYLNIAGIGFNASVVKNTKLISAKLFQSKYNYLLALVMSLIGYKVATVAMTTDDMLTDKQIVAFAINIGICRYNGGGMMMVPHARYDDGLLSLTVVKKINRLKIIRNFFRLFDGSFIRKKEVETLNTPKVTISADSPVGVEMDGELAGKSKLITFENLEKKLSVVTGNI
ncbi:diacylglycerol kinase family lipid kinase [Fulvivirgaceae bacterium BMA12]|uniref:Diacylglycerol kinase family lipid kinase n=1 Tax=Agaribacillus aureus TaxID=3051825 RepID=A0ABT8LFZ3_9BACT|nr:diacylglycerol kinase family lipid kinase [Fulvivirgaceae bacterium BMA12]